MATPDATTTALTNLVQYLSEQAPSPVLDDILVSLTGPIDPETGAPTAAMDRRLRRQVAAGRIAADAAGKPAREARFQNANRLRQI